MNEQNFQTRIGKGMVILAWIGVLGVLTLYFSRFLDQQHNPNQDLETAATTQFKQVQLQRNRAGHYVANGMINNKAVVFMLDTGATDISIPAHIAQKLKLRAGLKTPARTANGQIYVYATTLDRVSLGAIALNDVSANINPYMQGDQILLGMSFLKKLDFLQQGDQLFIRQY